MPIINLSLVDLCFLNARDTAFDEINPIMKAAADGEQKGILGSNADPPASSDFNHDPRSSNFEATLTWGFSNRMLDSTVAPTAEK